MHDGLVVVRCTKTLKAPGTLLAEYLMISCKVNRKRRLGPYAARVIGELKGRYTRGSLLPQHVPATRSRGKAPSSAPTISSEKICCATKLLLPSFAPTYQTGLIWGSKLQGQNCCTILFQEQAPSCVLKFALRERVSGASSLVYTEICFAEACVSGPSSIVCTGWGTYPGACFGSVFQEQASSCVLVGVLTRERVSGACFRSKLPRVYRP